MEIEKKDGIIFIRTSLYSFEINEQGFFKYNENNSTLLEANILSYADSIDRIDETTIEKISLDNFDIIVNFNSSSWENEKMIIHLFENYIVFSLIVRGTSKITDVRYFNIIDGYKTYIAPRFDWSAFPVIKNIDENDILSCQQWLSPPPFAMVLTDNNNYQALGVMAKKGENNFERVEIGRQIKLCFEGHLEVDNCEYELPSLVLSPRSNNLEKALSNYVDILKENKCITNIDKKIIPSWWNKPIFCGWGQMRYDYRRDHDGHENGNFVNVTDYCSQNRYSEYVNDLESNDINPGTIIIDMGWAKNAALGQEDLDKWPDLKGFIKREHDKGRHVLLWYSPLISQGLSKDCCLTLEGRAVAPDPTNEKYFQILKNEITYMLKELDADGFKIDFTQNTPSEEDIFTTYINSFWGLINENNEKHLYKKRTERKELIKVSKKNVWGVELLKLYIENLYKIMKEVKKDSLLITHTCNPYFSDVVDMLRLNDLDGESDAVLEIMKGRAMLARISCDKWLIDTDNDLMVDLNHWRDYISIQSKLGIPDTYYTNHIAMSFEKLTKDDYSLLKKVFDSFEYENKWREVNEKSC